MQPSLKAEYRVIAVSVLFILFLSATLFFAVQKRFSKSLVTAERGSFLKNQSRFKPRSAMKPLSFFADTFLFDGTLEETGALADSQSPFWWVNSGGRFIVASGTGQTIHGALSPNDSWYRKYRASNPQDTDNGAHPQNIFRLVQTNQWTNFALRLISK